MDPRGKRQLGKTGLELTQLGYGGAHLGELYAPAPDDEAAAAVAAAHEIGVGYFDTAPWYGRGLSEHRLGHILRRLPRDDFVLSSKVGRVLFRPAETPFDTAPWAGGLPFDLRFDYTRDGIRRSYEDSLQRLGMTRLDLLFIHDLDVGYHGEKGVAARISELDDGGGWRVLDQLKAAGEIAGVGAGISEAAMIPRLLARFELDALLVAMPYTLLDQDALDEALPLCEARGVGVVIGSPYASGVLATGAVAGANYAYAAAEGEVLDRVAAIERVCVAHRVPLKAAALQFPLGHPSVASVIPGAVSPGHVRDNAAMLAVDIPPALWADLKAEGLIRGDAPTP